MDDKREKKASIALETLIAFSIFLLLLVYIVNMISLYRSDILMQRALEKTSEDLELLTPLSVSASDTISTMINAMPEGSLGGCSSAMALVGKVFGGIDLASGNELKDLLVEGLLSDKIRDDIASEYVRYNNGSEFFLPDKIEVSIKLSDIHQMIEVYVTYSTSTIAGEFERDLYSIIPFYGYFDLFLNGMQADDDNEISGDEFWELSNFSKGDHLREEFGSNLPENFPVINIFKDHEAISVVSCDLTAPKYISITAVNYVVTKEINSLSSFDGASVKYSGEEYTVDGDDINRKILILLIPENSPEESCKVLDLQKKYASLMGVELDVRKYGVSAKYS